MTRMEAEELIERIHRDWAPLERSEHFRWRLGHRLYTMHDVRAIIKSHVMISAPEWRERDANFTVRLRGKCLEGRPTLLVLGLRPPDGPHVLVTIAEEGREPRGKAWRSR